MMREKSNNRMKRNTEKRKRGGNKDKGRRERINEGTH